MTKKTPFDYLNSINQTKEYLMEDEKDYNQWMVTKGLSYFTDTVFYANEVNLLDIDNKQHYDYLINIIRPRKRFSKWFKKSDDDDINAIMEYYKVSPIKAKEYSLILSSEQKQELKEFLKKD